MDAAEMLPQVKASKTQKTPSHEFCHGYVDRNGIWNNGFHCRRWGKPDDKYCCGDVGERYCCPEPVSSPSTRSPSSESSLHVSPSFPDLDLSDGNSILLPIIIGSGVGVALILCCLVVVCLMCRVGRRRRSNKPITGNKRLSFNIEAEATSAVIAAQALQKDEQKLKQQQHQHQQLLGHDLKPHPCSGGEDGPLHCGCRWSPSTSRSTVVDLDSLIATMQQNISWQQQDMETSLGHPVNCPCDQHGRAYNPLPLQGKRLFGSGERPLNGSASPSLTMDPYRPPSLTSTTRQQHQQQPPYYPLDESVKAIHGSSEQSSLLSDRSTRAYTCSPHSQMNDLRQLKCLVQECSERQRRDSGVLVEEPDVVQVANPSSFIPNYPSPPPQLLILNSR